jgi:non-specific protein-tyrosine kinase
VTISDYLQIIRKRIVIVVAGIVVALLAASAYAFLVTEKYEATAQLFVSASDGGDSASNLQSGAQFSQDRVQSYADIIGSRKLTNQVAATLNVGLTGKQISKEISANAPLNTVLINLHVTDTSAARAQELANAIANEFTSYVPFLEASSDGSTTGTPVKVTVVQSASLPDSPVSPNKPLALALGLLAGIGIGVGGAVLRETMDKSVKTPEDILAATSRPVIGAIAFDPEAKSHPLIVSQHPHSTRAEAFRQLRTNLQFVDIDTELKSIVITSSVPNEGKTTTVCNLAITLAQTGAKVLLIEADLRRPRLAEYLGLDGSVGLTSVLLGAATVAEATQRWGDTGLQVLASGPLPPNPSELLSSHAMADLLRRLEDGYDVVLLDAPPLLPVTDAALLAAATSGAVLIARHGTTTRDQLSRSANALHAGVGAKILGTVINMTPKRGPDAYYYGYAYSYGPHKAAKSTVRQGAAMPAPSPMPTRSNGRAATNGDGLDPIITESPLRKKPPARR